MGSMSICRTCLSNKIQKDITELQAHNHDTCSDIVLFCLNIQVEEDSKISTKLCLKCYKKIMSFYKFKLLALKSDTYLKTAEADGCIKNEVFLQDDIKIEDASSPESDTADRFEVKLEPKDNLDETDGHSDNEFLSVIKQIKYEYVTEEVEEDTKEKAPAKIKRTKRGRPPNINGKKKSKSVSTAQVCEECGKSVKNLKEHSLLHMPSAIRKRYPCKLCDKTFASYSARNKHKSFKHLGLKKSCPICGKLVVSVHAHTLTVHRSSELRHACAPCGRRFISQSALDAHTSVHTKERPHACDACDKNFRSKTVMLQHKRQVHEKEKSHLCQFCSKSFFKKYHLQVHLRSHTKEKPYQCPQCDKSFASSSILNNHRTVHSDVKQFVCTHCTMTFARSGYLRAHMLSHTKEKKYPCNYCGVKFLRSDHRKRHEHTAHERHLVSSLNSNDTKPIFARDPPAQTSCGVSNLSVKETESIVDRRSVAALPGLAYGYNSAVNGDSGACSP